MKTLNLNIIDLFKGAWKASEKRFIYFAIAVDLLMLLSNIPEYLLDNNESFFAVLLSVFIFMLQPWITLGIIKMSLKVIDDKDISYKDFSFDITYIFRFMALSLLVGVIVLFMFLMLIVPGIIATLSLMFVSVIFIDKELSIFECLSASQKMTSGKKWDLFKIWIIVFILNIIGAIIFGIGLLFTIPFTFIIIAYLYRGLEKGYFVISDKNSSSEKIVVENVVTKKSVRKTTEKKKRIVKKTSTKKKVDTKEKKK